MATRDQEQETSEYFLTETELARRWKVSVKTLQNARVAGTGIRFVKLGRAVRYRIADVEQFEAASIRLSTSDKIEKDSPFA